MHSTASDGRLSPKGVLESAAIGGLQVIALTDHDVYPKLQFGLHHVSKTEKKTTISKQHVFVIHGTEISVSYENTEQHLLVYFPKEAPEDFRSYCQNLCKRRAQRYDEIIDRLRDKGCRTLEYSCEDAKQGHRALTRLHVAQELVKLGYVKNISEAFDLWLIHLEFPETFPKIEDVLNDMKEMGGMTSWAHPKLKDAKRWLPTFQKSGLQAVEVYRAANKKYVAKKQLISLAKSNNLHLTGGSDSHGSRPLGRFFIGLANYHSWMKSLGLWEEIQNSFENAV
jgi:3',5'-nucleoside bisphosphate phosphatase